MDWKSDFEGGTAEFCAMDLHMVKLNNKNMKILIDTNN